MFSWLDLILALVLLWAGLRGLRQGLVRVVFGFLAIGLAVLVACKSFGPLAVWSGHWFNWSPLFRQIVSFTAIWLLVCLVIVLFGNALRQVIHLTPLGLLDTTGGALLGLAKGGLFLILILMPIFVLRDNRALPGFLDQAVQKSYLVRQAEPLIVLSSRTINHFLPDRQAFRQHNVFFLLAVPASSTAEPSAAKPEALPAPADQP